MGLISREFHNGDFRRAGEAFEQYSFAVQGPKPLPGEGVDSAARRYPERQLVLGTVRPKRDPDRISRSRAVVAETVPLPSLRRGELDITIMAVPDEADGVEQARLARPAGAEEHVNRSQVQLDVGY